MGFQTEFEIFLVAPPGLEAVLCEEAREKGFAQPATVPGGVTLRGGWPEVWRANLDLRGAARVLVRIASFRALHLAQLDKRARKVPWTDVLRPDRALRIDVVCRRSRIYHAGAARDRIARAIREELGASVSEDAALGVKVRIDDDLCTISVDASGAPLHKRGYKEAVGKAPMRETLAALFLRQCGYRGTEPVLDPMCGSGTFVIEAAEIAAGLSPGRSRRFAFEDLAGFDDAAWQRMRSSAVSAMPNLVFRGCDRDAGAISAARANAARAGVGALTTFSQQPIAALEPPAGPPGLVIVNPPYGARIGNARSLYPLYRTFGEVLARRFAGWRVGLVTSDRALARATGLPIAPAGPPVPHGGLKVQLFRSGPLA